MGEVEAKQYKVEQTVLNKLYKKLKQDIDIFQFKERKELKQTLYERCLQQVFIKKDSIKLTFIERWEYDTHYGGDGAMFLVNMVTMFDDYVAGTTLCQEYIHYRDIKKAVYNEKRQRLEIYGTVKYKRAGEKKQKEVLMIYNLFDLRELIQTIEATCNIKVTKV